MGANKVQRGFESYMSQSWDIEMSETGIERTISTQKHILDYERRLEKLRHDGLVQEFVKKLSSLILDIDKMYKEDRLFNFSSRF